MSPNPTPTVPAVTISKLDQALTIIEVITEVAKAVPGVGAIAGIADKLLQIAQAAIKAHEAATGEPLDLAKLHEITPVE